MRREHRPPQASEAQKKAIAIELNKILRWCLTESLQPDGSFRFVEGDNSREQGTYYRASFHGRIGFFRQVEALLDRPRLSASGKRSPKNHLLHWEPSKKGARPEAVIMKRSEAG